MWNILYSYLNTHKILTEPPAAGNISNYVYQSHLPSPVLGGGNSDTKYVQQEKVGIKKSTRNTLVHQGHSYTHIVNCVAYKVHTVDYKIVHALLCLVPSVDTSSRKPLKRTVNTDQLVTAP
jgi:hypothetical protein